MCFAPLRSCGSIWRKAKPLLGNESSSPAKQIVDAADWVQPRGDSADGFGGKAPICPPPPPKRKDGPITLEVIQGEWLSGNGSQIAVVGTSVYMNGVELRGQRVEMNEDGVVCRVGQRLQVDGWSEAGAIQFRANSPDGSYMEFAPKEVWTRVDSTDSRVRDERLRLLGYAGTAASLEAGTRGVEGCIPGTLCQLMPDPKDAFDVGLLQALISQWREPALENVCSRDVVPDFINRENTGVGVELVHYIAISMRDKGFKKRTDRSGHDIPVVVREPPGTDSHQQALRAWRDKVLEEEGFPPVRISPGDEMFTSLGNGHFFQALNLYDCKCQFLNSAGNYAIGNDEALRDAVMTGVPSIVLRASTPRPVRAKLATLLNAKHEFRWRLKSDGTLDISDAEESFEYCPQFEAMSKHLDAVVVNSLVRTHLGIKDSKRIKG
eukprot:TRINITY_DN27306_c0_g1_i4.p1 TRINITY_DN27306_c0_g1~~TRINITY_DN27306_c0_g1_i4.p1  ORF type:complete len:436 (-),score=54.23 TRINITY_DN27306_c0_g1_i4:93-1400(-)